MAVGDLSYNASNNKPSATLVKHYFTFSWDVLADATTYLRRFRLPFLGRLSDIQMSLDVTGTDGTDVEVDVQDDTVSMLSTLPAMTVAAADDLVIATGDGAVTGTVVPIINTAVDTPAENSVILVSVLADGTFTVQPSGLVVTLEFVEQQNFNPTA